MVKPIIEKFVNNKAFEEAYLGMFGYDKEALPYLDSKLTIDKGVYVAQIVLGGPCSKTELKVGDIITKIDNVELNKMTELRSYIYSKNPSDIVTLTLIRNNKEYTMKVELRKEGLRHLTLCKTIV